MLSRVVGNSGTANYLDITCLKEGITESKVALVNGTNAGIAKNESGYFKFYLKDVNSNVITGMLFNVADFTKSGLRVSALKNKPVQIVFTPQIYGGSWSLVLDSITLWDGEFDYSKFRGKIQVDKSIMETVLEELFGDTRYLRPEYDTTSLNTVLQGRVGGFLYLLESGTRSLLNYLKLQGVEKLPLMKCYFVGMSAYFDYLQDIEKFDITSAMEAYNIIQRVSMRYSSEPYRLCILDVCRSLLGLTPPEHLYAHLIYATIDQIRRDSDLVLKAFGLPDGARVVVDGGGVLLKY